MMSLRSILSPLKMMANHCAVALAMAVIMTVTAVVCSPADATSIPVRFPEGIAHGFLLVRSLAGEIIGQGEMTQVVKEGDQVESHLAFTFKDGSLHDEHVIFSQQRVFK
ncbi:hypothetical protein, partial [Petrachloros mirabilis]